MKHLFQSMLVCLVLIACTQIPDGGTGLEPAPTLSSPMSPPIKTDQLEKTVSFPLKFGQDIIFVDVVISERFDPGLQLLERNLSILASKAFEEIQKQNPQDINAAFNVGSAYFLAKEVDKAVAFYDKAVAMNPRIAKIYSNRAHALASIEFYEDAVKDYTLALELVPDHAETYTNRGLAYQKQEKYQEALSDHNKAIEIEPDFERAYNNRGIAHYYQEQYEQAITDYNKTLVLNSNFAPAYFNRGLAYEKINKKERACPDYKKSCELKHEPACLYLAFRKPCEGQ